MDMIVCLCQHSKREAWQHGSPDILNLVLVGHGDVLAAGLEVVVCDAAEAVVLHTKGGVNHIVYVVVPAGNGAEQSVRAGQQPGQEGNHSQHPLEAAVELGVHTLHVLQDDRQTQELLQGHSTRVTCWARPQGGAYLGGSALELTL